MAQPLTKEALEPAPSPTTAPPEAMFGSPARRLQQDLERALVGAGESRWSTRRSLGFIVLTNGILWIALVWAIRAL